MDKLKEIAEWFSNWGINLYIVGGAVRDELMGNPIEDVDVCVVGADFSGEVGCKLAGWIMAQRYNLKQGSIL